MALLPINRDEMEKRGWETLDFLFITGDAYVDHPSFGTAILTRVLEDKGYRVGVCSQPKLDDDESILAMGKPLYGVFISSGVVDSMVNNYTAARRRRSDDKYSPGGEGGIRPDRALTLYSQWVRNIFGDIPLVIGGVEGSLRRFAHYDYWSDKVRGSILIDSGADILVYGMGESNIVQIAYLLAKGADVRRINSLSGTCVGLSEDELPNAISSFIHENINYSFLDKKYTNEELKKGVFPINDKYVLLPSYKEVSESKIAYAAAFKTQYQEQDPLTGRTLIQVHGDKFVIQNPPSKPLSVKEMDAIYALPFERKFHDIYLDKGNIPSIEEVEFSITSQRGCYGGCHFCAITLHQGRIVQRRSKESVIREANIIVNSPGFKGYIHDVGGPTANFHERACEKQEKGGVCKTKECMSPKICPSLKIDHSRYLDLLRTLRQIPGVKKVFVRSGVRFDYLMADKNDTFFKELVSNHISGQLKVAPEHISDNVLQAMGKPGSKVYDEFKSAYEKENKRIGKKQFLVPYLISGHPGSTLKDAIKLAIHIKQNGVMPKQVQDFYPTPGTVSTTMYYTKINPLTFEPIYVPDEKEKSMQRALLQFSDPKNYRMVERALILADRRDLIGFGPDCLIRPIKKDPSKKSAKLNKNKKIQNFGG